MKGSKSRFGEPVEVKGFGELKLLYQMYNPDEKIEEKNDLGKAAHELSFFTKKTLGTNYPWRFVKESNGSKFIRSVRTAFLKSSARCGSRCRYRAYDWRSHWSVNRCVGDYGYACFIRCSHRRRSDGRRWKPGRLRKVWISMPSRRSAGFSIKSRLSFRKEEAHTVTLPILGNFTWYTDHGKGSVISSPSEAGAFQQDAGSGLENNAA